MALFWIPGDLAYGNRARPGPNGPPTGDLVFDVELVDLKQGPKPPEVPADVKGAPADAKKTASGLQYKTITPGKGTKHPKATDKVTVNYSGWTPDGKMFDSSVTRGTPASFGLDHVIKGWTEGVQLMVEGDKTRFWIPSDLAYGDKPSRPGALRGRPARLRHRAHLDPITSVALPTCGSFGLVALAACTPTPHEPRDGPRRGAVGRGPVPDAWKGAGSISSASAPVTVAYATASPAETLDLFLPQRGAKPYPVVIRIHGGGFDTGSAHMVETGLAAERIVAAGYALAAINYRLATEAPFPASGRDAKAAVRFLRASAARFDLDPKRFAAWGDDSGGWFAVMLGVTGDQATIYDDPSLGNANVSAAVQGVVDWYGPIDLASADAQSAEHPPLACVDSYRHHSGAGTPESRWLCGDRETPLADAQCASAVRDANLVRYIATAHDLPAFSIAHGADDCELPWGQSVELTQALQRSARRRSRTRRRPARSTATR